MAVKTKNTEPNLPVLSTKRTQQINNQEQVPNFIGRTLKQALRMGKDVGLNIDNVGFSGRVVWQSPRPGADLKSCQSCKIKLESNS